MENNHLSSPLLNLLFVCMGNTCRSPMAAAFARKLFGNRAKVQSAGISVTAVTPSLFAVKVLKLVYETDISGHNPQPVQALNLNGFTHVIALDGYVGAFLTNPYPAIAEKLHVWNINDPYGSTEAEYAACAAEILHNLTLWCAHLQL